MAMMIAMPSKSTLGREIGERARILAHRKGLSQGQVAVNAGLSQPTVSALFSGGTQDPPVGTVLKIARVLDVPIDQLLGLSPLPEVSAPAVDHGTVPTRAEFQQLAGLVEDLAQAIKRSADARIVEREQKEQSRRTQRKAV